MQININVQGYGKYQIPVEKVSELLTWLSKQQAVRINEKNTIREVLDNQYTGRELITEVT